MAQLRHLPGTAARRRPLEGKAEHPASAWSSGWEATALGPRLCRGWGSL